MKMFFSLFALLSCAMPRVQPLASQTAPLSPHEAHLPAETIAAFSILDSQQWQSDWNATGIARYLAEPAIAEYFESVVSEAKSNRALLALLGTLESELSLAGQASVAAINLNSKAEFVFMLDFSNDKAATDFQDQLSQKANQNKRKSKAATFDGNSLITFFETDSNRERITCCVRGKQFLAATQATLLTELLSRGESLRQSPTFASTVGQMSGECNSPMFWWYLKPVEVYEIAGESRDKGQHLQIARKEKLDTIEAIGGIGSLKQLDLSLFLAGQILAKPPYQRSMRMLDLSESAWPAIPRWMSSATSAGFVNLRLDSFLSSFSTLFDTVVGEGEEGVFESVLDDLNSAPQGPKIDLQKEMMAELKTPICFSSDVNSKSIQSLVGIECRDQEKIKTAVTKMFTGDSRAQPVANIDYPAWKVLPLEGNPAGIRDPFVMAIRDGFLIFAPDINSIEHAFDPQKSGTFQLAGNSSIGMKTASFGYAADLRSLAGKRHGQLKSGTLDGWPKILAERLETGEALKNADRSRLPEFAAVKKYFDAELKLFGSANENGWKVIAVIE